jgi:uncharacterized protein YdhG (YjbR/CyaY superfamily)/uncharacterized protein YndB with AHSA1/START domain
METKKKYSTVDEYISAYPENVRKQLLDLRQIIRKAAPDAVEKIGYNMPAYTYKGILLYFAAHTNHIGFYPTKSAITAFEKELSEYNCSAGTIQFPFNKPLPVGLINRIVKFRVVENNLKAEKKSKKNVPGNNKIIVQVTVKAGIEKVWKLWTTPEDIVNWNFASETWHTPSAVNNLKKGGRFSYRMEAKDGSFGFDFGGKYTAVKVNELIEYTLGDDRKVRIEFSQNGKETTISESFDAESVNSPERQKEGWQAILNNFRKYAEKKK